MALALLAFIGVGLLLYGPALEGAFISDDLHYVVENPYIQTPSWENLIAILNPRGSVPVLVENYAPVHLLLHGLTWQLFGESLYAFHVVNVVFHALASLLLVLLFRQTGLPSAAALLGGALFLVHPANVEAVAWISQLKSSSALVLSIAALLFCRTRPLTGLCLFGLALLAKPSALFAIPFAIVLLWCPLATRAGASGDPIGLHDLEGLRDPEVRRAWAWIAGWVALFLAFCLIELSVFSQTAAHVGSPYGDEALPVRLRSSLAILCRYLVAAASSYGLSTFHEPAPALSWLDPWWLGSLAALALLGWRSLYTLWKGRVEAAYWGWAVASFAPVSGLVSLPYPMADRYLYFVLPGLIGALLFAAGDALRWLEGRTHERAGDPAKLRRVAHAAAIALVLALGLVFSLRSHQRAAVWRSAPFVMADAVEHYPNGSAALLRQADISARAGDADGTLSALHALYQRGFERFDLLMHPDYAFLREDPRFKALVDEVARKRIARIESSQAPGQIGYHTIGLVHNARGDTDAAIRAFERALEIGGAKDQQIRAELKKLRARQRREALRPPTGEGR